MNDNYRDAASMATFINAGKYLDVMPDRIISLKFRDLPMSSSVYREMLRILENETDILSSLIQDDLGRRGRLVSRGDQKIIVVRHETGLEILYIAGSVASIIGIIYTILQSFDVIPSYFNCHRSNHIHRVEIRRMDADGNIIEEQSHGSLITPSLIPDGLTTTLFLVANTLDNKLKELRLELQSHNERLAAIEQELKAHKATNARK